MSIIGSTARRYWIAGVVGVALALRVIWGLLVPVVPLSDAYAYDILALNLSQHGIYGFSLGDPSAFWPVGTAAAYALLYDVFGHSYDAVIIFNILVGLLIVVLTMNLVERWFGFEISIITGFIIAVWPTLIQFTTIIASELLFTALVLSVMLLVTIRSERSARGVLFLDIGCGVVMALAAYVRPIALLFPFLFGIILFLRAYEFRTSLRFAAVTVVTMAALIAPWTMRNLEVMGTFSIISTNGGVNLWMGNNPETTGEYQPPPERSAPLSEGEWDRQLGNEAKAHIIEEPVTFVIRTVVKAVRLYERETIGTVWNAVGIRGAFGDGAVIAFKVLSQAFWITAVLLFTLGIYSAWRELGWKLILHPGIIAIGYMTAVYAVIVIQDRYHIPTIPYIAVFAAIPIARLLLRRGQTVQCAI